MLRAATLTVLLTAMGCMHNVEVGYLEAADIHIASDVQTVIVINRSAAKNAGEHFLNGAEGLASGETFRLDAESAALAIESLEQVLADSPRFEVVNFVVNGNAVDTTMWDRAMTARKVRQLCRQTRCDAVIALETFDSDQFIAVEIDGPTREERRAAEHASTHADPPTFEATQHTDVTATFRMYDADTGAILDEQRATFDTLASSGEEDTASEALSELPHTDMVFEGAAVLGAEYAQRISPHQVMANRAIFKGGSKEMRQATRAAARGNLDRAAGIWRMVADTAPTTKLKARALHNLAVVAESRGQVRKALRLARQASELHGRKASDRYVATLRSRLGNDARVATQLGPAKVPAS